MSEQYHTIPLLALDSSTYDPRLLCAYERLDPNEARLGYTFRGGVKVYCCYGMYADVGHSNDCKHARTPAASVSSSNPAPAVNQGESGGGG